MKCPCCKVINSLDECLRHRSVTSAQAATRAWKSFTEIPGSDLALMVYPCPKHGSEDGFNAFVDAANAKKGEIVSRAKAEQEKVAAENIDMMFRSAVRTLFGI